MKQVRLKWLMSCIAVCLSLGCAVRESTSTVPRVLHSEAGVVRLTLEEAERLVRLRQAVLVDVRTPAAYHQAHIPGAINVPVSQIEAGNYGGPPRGMSIITYCT